MTDGAADDSPRVEELAATVDGLTTKLLDLQERVQDLESQLETEAAPETDSGEAMFAQADGGTDAEEASMEDVETIGDDIIVG